MERGAPREWAWYCFLPVFQGIAYVVHLLAWGFVTGSSVCLLPIGLPFFRNGFLKIRHRNAVLKYLYIHALSFENTRQNFIFLSYEVCWNFKDILEAIPVSLPLANRKAGVGGQRIADVFYRTHQRLDSQTDLMWMLCLLGCCISLSFCITIIWKARWETARYSEELPKM